MSELSIHPHRPVETQTSAEHSDGMSSLALANPKVQAVKCPSVSQASLGNEAAPGTGSLLTLVKPDASRAPGKTKNESHAAAPALDPLELFCAFNDVEIRKLINNPDALELRDLLSDVWQFSEFQALQREYPKMKIGHSYAATNCSAWKTTAAFFSLIWDCDRDPSNLKKFLGFLRKDENLARLKTLLDFSECSPGQAHEFPSRKAELLNSLYQGFDNSALDCWKAAGDLKKQSSSGEQRA